MNAQPHYNPARSRFELDRDGQTAFAAYEITDNVITFTHTVVPHELEGQGVASRLIGFALDDVRKRGVTVIAQCRFVAAYIGRHPETQNLLA